MERNNVYNPILKSVYMVLGIFCMDIFRQENGWYSEGSVRERVKARDNRNLLPAH